MIPELLSHPLPQQVDRPSILRTPYTDQDGLAWQVSAKACEVPTCFCSNVILELTAPGRDAISFGVDLEDEEIFKVNNEEIYDFNEGEMDDDIVPPLAEPFVAQWTQDNWNEIDRWHQYEKSFQISQIDTAAMSLLSCPSALADLSEYRNSWKVGFEDFFDSPFGTRFQFKDRQFLLHDRYCLRPGCSCGSATLHLGEETMSDPEEGSGFCHGRVTYTALASCAFEVDAGRCSDFELDDGSKDEFDFYIACLKAFANACRPESPIERRALLANLIERHSSLMPPDEPIAPTTIRRTTIKVGRNDPCPCGSGKKYKKCCG